jgi:GNAT superfamily N-acetyltransferase
MNNNEASLHTAATLQEAPAKIQAGIAAIFSRGKSEGWVPADRRELDHDDAVVWLEDSIGLICGFAVFGDMGNGRVWLDLIYVAPPRRRCGYGRRLMRAVVAAAQRSGFRRVLFGTAMNNAGMQGLARSEGYADEALQMAIDLPGARAAS